jgi:hypothetical protein
MRHWPSLSRVTSITGLSISSLSSDKVNNDVGESDTSTRGKCKTSSWAALRNTKSVTSNEGNQPLETVSKLPMLTSKPSDCEAMASMSLFQSKTLGTIQKCNVSAAKTTKPHAANTNHHIKPTTRA